MKLSPHFKQSEFACRCGCGLDDPRPELVAALELLHDRFRRLNPRKKVAIIITGPLRCRKQNDKTRGAVSHSRHLPRYRDGVDIRVYVGGIARHGWIIAMYAEKIEAFNSGGIGIYDKRCHVDTRGHKARWDYSTKRKRKKS